MTVSIITVNKDNREGLRATIASVIEYAPENSEYIVIDGASSDGSVDVIRDNVGHIDYWVSEADSGIYQAMNKGIQQSRGDYCLFLNSGDCLLPSNPLGWLKDEGQDVFYSDAPLVSDSNTKLIRFPHHVDVNYFVSGMLNHQNTLIRRELFTRIGLYSENARICSDWLFFLKAAREDDVVFCYVPQPMVEYHIGGISSDPQNDEEKAREMRAGIDEVFGRLAPTLHELVKYRNSVYGNIISLFGSHGSLDFLLKSYRFFLRRIDRLCR